ncbi:MAG: transketolase family protein [Patescibacteria group bacterium]|nr:transketolase family protein [Patescibacteria group bacterium]MDE2589601.1 transketolase family protein [Patescibacteria group bacterium]
MLNPYLHLNPKIFDADVEQKPTRDGFGTGIVALGEKDPNVVVLTADLSESTRADGFEKKFPERFFDVGVAEQNMVSVAAGLGVTGKTAFVSSYATFNPGRNWEQIRTNVVYNNANVKIAGHHSGIMTGPDGATHQATEDIASVRAWPGMNIYVPCDAIEARKVTIAAGMVYGPAYLRYSRDKTPLMTTEETPFDKKVQAFWVTENPQTTIFAMGYMLFYALLAAKELEQEGLQVLVANVSTLKPLDVDGVLALVEKSGSAVSVEDHQVAGGLGGLLAEVFAKHRPTPMEFIGLQDTFAESGKPGELVEKYGMGNHAIKDAVKKVIGRK